MILYEDNNYCDNIELEYTFFLAEQEYFKNLFTLSSKVYHESVGLILIQEDFIGTIKNYIDKIVSGIQKAWNTFKNKVLGYAAQPTIDNAKKLFKTYNDGTLLAENWHKYDMNKFNSLKIVEYDSLHNYSNKTDYLLKMYPGIFTDKNKSLKENIFDKVISTEDKHRITVEDMSQLIAFCDKDFKKMTNTLETDLANFNKTIQMVKSALNINNTENNTTTESQPNEQPPEQEIVNNSANILLDLYNENCILLEAPGDNNNNKSQKLTNTEKDTNNNKLAQQVQWYISGNTDLITTKMQILRKKYIDALNVLRVAFPKSSKNVEKKNKTTVKKIDKITNDQIEIY